MTTNSLAVYTPEKQREVLELLGLKGPPNQIQLLFQLGEKYQLDILTKEVTLIPGKGPFIGVWGRLHIAHRTGMLDGLEMDQEEEDDRHYKVRCVVWRKDQSRPAAKVVGRVGRHEKKDWPFEIARARAVRAALGFAFSIHDTFDTYDEDEWTAAPDERIDANGTVIQAATPTEEVTTPAPAAKKQRRVNKKTGEVIDVPPAPPGDTSVAQDTRPESSATSGPGPAPPPDNPEPATVVVGGHTPAQKIAMAARNAGIDDDETRHDVITAATAGKAKRGQEVQPDQYDRVIAAFDGLADGSVELRYQPDGTPKLYKVRR